MQTTSELDRGDEVPGSPIEEVLLRIHQVVTVTGLSRSSLYSFVAMGRFPALVRIGRRAVAWKNSQVQAWIAALTAPPSDAA